MGQALYRKYRSKNFEEVVGQEHITATLNAALRSGRISHAYLFTGPRGVGKTTVARILAHRLNNLEYKDETPDLDIIEIDGASNRRIDEVRELRDRIYSAPTKGPYKIYIIDEVHMLTREAFNALLKTLEEPPAHCIFILATTEVHKLPETIISRTQRFEFKPIEATSAAAYLAQIAKKEKIIIEPEALKLIAEHGRGSFRDSISLLDQLSSASTKISTAQVRQFLGLPPRKLVDQLAGAIAAGDGAQSINLLDQLSSQGVDASAVARTLAGQLRQGFIDNPTLKWIPSLLRRLIEIPASLNPQDSLEIAALESAADNGASVEIGTIMASTASPAPTAAAQPHPTKRASVSAPGSEPKANFSPEIWGAILDEVKRQAASLYTALRLAQPKVEGKTLILSFQFPLHQKKVSSAQNKELISKIVAKLVKPKLDIQTVVDRQEATEPAEPELETISNIFGPTEVLES